MTLFLTPYCPMPMYMAFPRYLLDMDKLNETAKILYIVLLDRARLSQKNEGWTDEQNHVYIYYSIQNLADTMHKSETSIKTALRALEKEELIVRKHQGVGFPNRIYVKLPSELIQEERYFTARQTENCPIDGQKTVSVTDRKLSGSNNEKNKIRRTNIESKDGRTAFGDYQNVFLSVEELTALQNDVPRYYREYIEKLSVYMVFSGKQYPNHAATIRSWILRDHPATVRRNYDCKENESL